MTQPREIIAYAPPGGTFKPADYPWLKSLRVTLQGATETEDGAVFVELYDQPFAFEPNPNCPYPVTCKLSKNCQGLCFR